MAAAILERARHPARPQPRRREHGRRRGLHAARRRAARRHRRRPRPVRGRRVLARRASSTSSTRARSCSPTSSATSSTATASSTRSPTAGPRSSRAATAARPLVLNADDPTVADLGRDRRRRDLLRRRGPTRGAARDAARLRRQALPPLRARLRLRRRLPRPPRPLPLPATAGATGPTPHVAADDVVLDGTRGAPLHPAHAGGRRPPSRSRLPGLYNVYNALGAAALCPRPRRRARRRRRRARGRRGRLRPGRDRDELGGRARCRSCSSRTPPGANEVLRTLALEAGEHDLLAVLNDNIADGRDVSWVWDADWELARRRACAGSPARARAPPRWRCG